MDDKGAPQLPDFSGGGRSGTPGLPDFSGAGSGEPAGGGHSGGPTFGGDPAGPDGGGSGGGRGPLLALLLGGAGLLVVVLVVIALILSQTVFRGGEEDPTAADGTTATEEADPEDSQNPEYKPTEEQTDEAGEGETTMLEQPTSPCILVDNAQSTEQADGAVRGGGLEIPVPEGWEVGNNWYREAPYVTDMFFTDQPVEDGWYTVVGVGAVSFPEEEGGYPGAEEAARTIFQCGLTTADSEEIYGSPVSLSNYRDEAFTVDGHDAWIVSADVAVSDLALLDSTESWRKVVIVVDAPSGPAVFDGGAAMGHDQQVADLETMTEGLTVL